LVHIARPATGLVEVCFGSKATDLQWSRNVRFASHSDRIAAPHQVTKPAQEETLRRPLKMIFYNERGRRLIGLFIVGPNCPAGLGVH
jgi:hypothetical protein